MNLDTFLETQALQAVSKSLRGDLEGYGASV
jgi:hypothetical protein